jgi:hypothetical protein
MQLLPAFYGILKFFAKFIKAPSPPTGPYLEPDQSSLYHPILSL